MSGEPSEAKSSNADMAKPVVKLDSLQGLLKGAGHASISLNKIRKQGLKRNTDDAK